METQDDPCPGSARQARPAVARHGNARQSRQRKTMLVQVRLGLAWDGSARQTTRERIRMLISKVSKEDIERIIAKAKEKWARTDKKATPAMDQIEKTARRRDK